MHHWIVTNREVVRKRVDGALVEQVADTQKALPTFRVATFEVPTGPVTDNILERAVKLVPDSFGDDYTKITPDEDPQKLRGSRRLFAEIYRQMREDPKEKGDTLVFIHGFQYPWHAALDHLHRLHRLYVEPPESPIARIVYFTWPSGPGPFDYLPARARVRDSSLAFSRLLEKLIHFHYQFLAEAPSCGRHIHLAAHSMGGQILRGAMAELRNESWAQREIFCEVVLLNADVGWDVFAPGQPFDRLYRFCGRIHSYNHRSDDILVLGMIKNFERRLGRNGPENPDALPPDTLLVDASRLDDQNPNPVGDPEGFLARAESIVGKKVALRERLFDHWGYLHRKEVVEDLYEVFRGTSSTSIQGRDRLTDRLFRLRPGV